MVEEHDFDRAVAIAEKALAYLKQLHTAPIPRNFELFYTYVAGHNKPLNQALRDAVFAHARLPDAEAQRLFESHLAHGKLNGKVEQVSAQMSAELAEIVETIHKASEFTGDFGQSLEGLILQLSRIASPTQLKAVVDTLLATTKEMADNSRKLEKRVAESRQVIQELHENLEAVRAESLTDELTGIANRKRFDQVLEIEVFEAQESGGELCLILVDVDHFKRFNDNFGHQTGDQVLRLVAQTLQNNIRPGDRASRYGGEEFAVLLPKTALKEAVALAETIRKAIRSRELVKKSSRQTLGYVTISSGVTAYQHGEPPEHFVQRADKYLYMAKQGGRDRVDCGDELQQAAPLQRADAA